MYQYMSWYLFFFFNDTATTEIYTLSLHDALPIFVAVVLSAAIFAVAHVIPILLPALFVVGIILALAYELSGSLWLSRSEEHTSELQSRQYLVCRLLLEKKKNRPQTNRLDNHQHEK